LKSLFAATCASFALNAVSQTADTPVSSAADTAAAAQDASSTAATRAANRKLTRSVSTALARTKGLDSTRIFVKSVTGAVTLSGTVPDASHCARCRHGAAGRRGEVGEELLARRYARHFSELTSKLGASVAIVKPAAVFLTIPLKRSSPALPQGRCPSAMSISMCCVRP
jgi:hypothetical protein